jgi:hypothetical protein
VRDTVDLHEDLVEVPPPVFAGIHSLTRLRRISEASIGPNLFLHNRTVSWPISMPRSCSRSATFRGDSGKRIYSITATQMISVEVFEVAEGGAFGHEGEAR